MRLLLILIVAALVYDAVANDGATTKRVWAEIVDFFDSQTAAKPG
jgi:hypothetical protein